MHILTLSLLIGMGSLTAGLIGALTGLGGGVVIVPLLTLALGVDIHYAIGASLISVIATSSTSASAYIKEGFSNLRLGMFLEIATILGALSGTLLSNVVPPKYIAIIFGLVLIPSAWASWQDSKDSDHTPNNPIAKRLRMDSSYPDHNGKPKQYHVQHVPGGFSIMYVAGILSGLLGIGSGELKVIGMDKVMRTPFKVSTTTSNFMIGVTAATSASVYFNRGYIDPVLSMPIMLGVLIGSAVGTHFLMKTRTKPLKIIFSIIIVLLAGDMIFNGFAGKFQ